MRLLRLALLGLLLLAADAASAERVLRAAVLNFGEYPAIGEAEARDAAARANRLFEGIFGVAIRIEVEAVSDARKAFDRYVPPGRRLDRSEEPTAAELEKMRKTLGDMIVSTK